MDSSELKASHARADWSGWSAVAAGKTQSSNWSTHDYCASMNPLLSRITVEPGKCGGRPCIRGYRLRVKDVLELLANGASWEGILADYPFLEADDIKACLEFAAAQNDHVVLRAS